MADDERKALVVQGPRSLAEVGAGARKILSSVVSDALTVASSREKALRSTPFRIGSYEFREPDYRQIMIWAEALEIDPESLVRRLETTSFTSSEHGYSFEDTTAFGVERGAIVSLAWDFAALPLNSFDWVRGLSIREIAVFGATAKHNQITFQLASVQWLKIASTNLTKLDLSNLPNLTYIHCLNNQFTELNLLKLSALKMISCDNNQLTVLNIYDLPDLGILNCRNSRLTELNLSKLPVFVHLDCRSNRLTSLEFSQMPSLEGLFCHDNQLTELNLSNVPRLWVLWCESNRLSELDLSNAPELTSLICTENQLTELDLSAVPNLTKLHCEKNLITELDVTANTALTQLRCDPSVRVVKLPSQNFER